jgi:hypothetical protein
MLKCKVNSLSSPDRLSFWFNWLVCHSNMARELEVSTSNLSLQHLPNPIASGDEMNFGFSGVY